MKSGKEKEPALAGTRTSSNLNINNESIPQATENVNTGCYYKVMTQLLESITSILPQAKTIYVDANNKEKYAIIDLKFQNNGERDISVKVEVNKETD